MAEEAIALDPAAEAQARSQPDGLRGLSQKILVYFREFLEHDFRRQLIPRRRIRLKTDAGYRCALDTRKYGSLFRDVWQLAGKPCGEAELRIGRRTYKAQISPLLRNLVGQYAGTITEQSLADVRSEVLAKALADRPNGVDNPQQYAEDLVAKLLESMSAKVDPILAMLEGPFKEAAYSVEESIFEIESELTEALCAAAAQHIPVAGNDCILKGDSTALKDVLEEFVQLRAVQDQVNAFFTDFAAADAHQEVRDLINYCRSEDSLTTYLYWGAVRLGTNDFPLFIMPVSVEPGEDGAYRLKGDTRLFVNKQALEWIAQEMKTSTERVKTSLVADRIIHLKPQDAALDRMQKIASWVAPMLDVPGDIDLSDPTPQTIRSAQVRLSNAAYLAVFDRSEESLVNDYEALLSSLDRDHVAAAQMFEDIVHSVLYKDPVSVSAAVRQEWSERATEDRLVTRSPIPLNEEQIRIEMALARPETRFVAVSGPPGTGKSHTITALAFNAILDGKSVLVVSDKTEALDVVQDKLEQALASVRTGDDFPNPILRLGREGGTYRALISGSTKTRIETHHKAQSAKIRLVKQQIEDEEFGLKERIRKTTSCLSSIELGDIERLMTVEAELDAGAKGWARAMAAHSTGKQSADLADAAAKCTDSDMQAVQLAFDAGTVAGLEAQLRLHRCAWQVVRAFPESTRSTSLDALRLFSEAGDTCLDELVKVIAASTALKRPVIGYMFRQAPLAELDQRLATLKARTPMGLARRLEPLKTAANGLAVIRSAMEQCGVPASDHKAIFALVTASKAPEEAADAVWPLVHKVQEVLRLCGLDVHTELGGTTGVLLTCRMAAQFLKVNDSVRTQFNSLPKMDFCAEKARLESLNAAVLAHEIDDRFLRFVEEKRNTAKTLGAMIKGREQFPVDQFKHLREAFPCVIAGIRELGDFVPLQREVFDLIILDEGSQVSVAQALPAMLRGKRVVVFGDLRQYSSVKSHNASNSVNASYMTDIEAHCRSRVTAAAEILNRLRRFDVKRSVLEFVELVANHHEMLRKHFRGYPETISYSAKTFYDGQLQAIKIRGVPIDEVIRFDYVEPAEGDTASRNVNKAEGAHILALLKEMLSEDGKRQTVAVITPLREQQVYLSKLLFDDADGDRFASELRLKVSTFDSIQGEERDICIYSMVATRDKDVLNYIFPVALTGGGEEAEEALKAQRLNVGFSRSKEAMWFVLSKPIGEFKGTIRKALQHYESVLNDKTVAIAEDTDPSSPMERRVLEWLKATQFFRENEEDLEIVAQFPIGDYLRQLDPTYKHPAYRVDFLLRYYGAERTHHVVLEYDGFHHFVDTDRVNDANWDRYYKPEDVERQLTLEAYGYRFLRLNRFNVGADPVAALDKRLRELIKTSHQSGRHETVDAIKEQAQALTDGTAKTCTRCNAIRPLEMFYDKNLGGGRGGHGRVCTKCKNKRSNKPSKLQVSQRKWFEYGSRR